VLPEETNIAYLLRRYKKGACTPEELQQLYHLLSAETTTDWEKALMETLLEPEHASQLGDDKFDRLYESLVANVMPQQQARRRPVKLWPYIAAASVMLALTISFYWFKNRGERTPAPQSLVVGVDVDPGGNRAMLKLANGQSVELSEEQSGIIMNDQILYDDGKGVLDAQHTENKAGSAIDVYELITPKGGTYQITLADGTKVWLNAASKLKYPARFIGKERVVTLEGEGYFSVSKDESKPFKVLSKGQELEVMGTEFNISAYGEESTVTTTLVNGRVKVGTARATAATRAPVILNPGQQATNTEGAEIKVHGVDVAPYVRWKEGVFYFDDTKLMDAMNQLSRWYDLEVIYEKGIPDIYLYGEIGRDKTLKEVLDMLAEVGIRFHIKKEGDSNKLLVLPR